MIKVISVNNDSVTIKMIMFSFEKEYYLCGSKE